MNRYMPLIVLVVLGQTVLAYILVENALIRRLSGPPPVELQEVKADVSVSDEPWVSHPRVSMINWNNKTPCSEI